MKKILLFLALVSLISSNVFPMKRKHTQDDIYKSKKQKTEQTHQRQSKKRKRCDKQNYFDSMPTDTIIPIVLELDISSMLKMAQTCKKFHFLINSDKFKQQFNRVQAKKTEKKYMGFLNSKAGKELITVTYNDENFVRIILTGGAGLAGIPYLLKERKEPKKTILLGKVIKFKSGALFFDPEIQQLLKQALEVEEYFSQKLTDEEKSELNNYTNIPEYIKSAIYFIKHYYFIKNIDFLKQITSNELAHADVNNTSECYIQCEKILSAFVKFLVLLADLVDNPKVRTALEKKLPKELVEEINNAIHETKQNSTDTGNCIIM